MTGLPGSLPIYRHKETEILKKIEETTSVDDLLVLWEDFYGDLKICCKMLRHYGKFNNKQLGEIHKKLSRASRATLPLFIKIQEIAISPNRLEGLDREQLLSLGMSIEIPVELPCWNYHSTIRFDPFIIRWYPRKLPEGNISKFERELDAEVQECNKKMWDCLYKACNFLNVEDNEEVFRYILPRCSDSVILEMIELIKNDNRSKKEVDSMLIFAARNMAKI